LVRLGLLASKVHVAHLVSQVLLVQLDPKVHRDFKDSQVLLEVQAIQVA